MAVIVGLSDNRTVMVDLDNVSFRKAKDLAFLTLKRFRLDGFIILKSSCKHYHVVFDKPKRWSEVIKIVSWMGIMANNRNVWKWVCMQAIKKYCTLRVSPKPVNPEGFKPVPRVVFRYGSQNRQIRLFLTLRRRVLRIVKRLGVYRKECQQA
jgi:hypothetical protein